MERLINPILLGDGERKSVTTLLKGMCEKLAADGCVMWRATTDSTVEQGSYTMLASWFEGITDSYPSVRSVSYSNKNSPGHASAEPGEAWLDNDFVLKPRRFAKDPFFQYHGIRHAMVMRFNYARSGRYGVVVLYRKDKCFVESDLGELKKLKDWLPNLYRAARDRTGFKLISRVAEILRKQTQKHENVRRGKEKQLKTKRALDGAQIEENEIEKDTIRQVGEAVRECFAGLETSIFLEPEETPGTFVCAWTDDKVMKVVNVRKQSYRASFKRPNGFSGFVLKTGESVHVYDTQHPERDEDECRRQAFDFEGHSGYAANAAEAANEHLGVNQEWALPPPHALLIAPVLADGHPLGFLRCWIAQNNPQYYSQDDEDLLRLVALDFGRVLGEWRDARLRRIRKAQVEKFTAEPWKGGNYDLNPSAEVEETDSLTKEVLQAILELVDALVPGSDINSVRLLDQEKQEFYFYLYPHRGTLVQGMTLARMQSMRFQLSADNLAAQVCRSAPFTPMLFAHLDEKNTLGYTQLYKGVRHIIVAPIVIESEVVGVLDIRSQSDDLLEPEALGWTKIIVFMMSLLIANQRHQITSQKSKVERDAALQAAKNERTLRNAFEDLAHQMKSPLVEARNRVCQWIERVPFQMEKSDVIIMRSLIDRAHTTTNLINLFAGYAAGKSPRLSLTTIGPAVVAQVIDEVCSNARPRIDLQRGIQIRYDTDEAFACAPPALRMERRLLAQAIVNLVDNAIKYSYAKTTVIVTCGRTKAGCFYIGVRNKGIPVKPDEVRHMTERGWRGGEAQLAAGEGNGLGLYIVDMIMRHHGGSLDIRPTDKDSGCTELRLIFPNEPPP